VEAEENVEPGATGMAAWQRAGPWSTR